jgi:hypothetical protein
MDHDVKPGPELGPKPAPEPGGRAGVGIRTEAGAEVGPGADGEPGLDGPDGPAAGLGAGLEPGLELADFGRRWAEAERRGDVAALDALLTEDFTAVGPRGFVLDKTKWLDRYASGGLVHDSFTWDEVTVRQYGRSAVAVGVQGQQSVYDGRDADGDFRVTQTIVEVDGRWRLAAVHLSPTGAHGHY